MPVVTIALNCQPASIALYDEVDVEVECSILRLDGISTSSDAVVNALFKQGVKTLIALIIRY